MQVAAAKFLASLSPELKTKATFAFDDAHRTEVVLHPAAGQGAKSTRKGVRLEEMTADQKTAALELLKTGLSAKGYEQATTIMSLEGLLADLEGPKGGDGAEHRAGTSSASSASRPPPGKWGWRFEGHHLSVNYTLDKGEVVSATPLLFAANPAEVKAGDKKGLRALPEIEDHARALIKSLDEKQDKAARQGKAVRGDQGGPAEGGGRQPRRHPGRGPDRRPAARRSRSSSRPTPSRHAGGHRRGRGEARKNTPPGKLYFAYSGSPEPGKPYTYRVYAPEFVVEFLNVQADSAKNPANHIHSAWRRLPSDFALSE